MNNRITESLKDRRVLNQFLIIVTNVLVSIVRLFSKFFGKNNFGVAIISLHKLGDTVFTIPALKLITQNSANPCTIVCYKENKSIYDIVFKENLNYLVLDKRDFIFGDRIASWRANKKVRSLSVEKIFDITGVMTSASLLFNSSAKEIIGWNRPYFKAVYSHFQFPINIQHSSDIYLNPLLSYFKKNPLNNEDFQKINLINSNLVGIAPFAGWKEKEWGINNFIQLSNKYLKKYKVKFILPADYSSEEVINAIQAEGITVERCKSVEELIYAVRQLKILIGNDSGPIQIAALLGIPTLTIYGPTNPTYHKPNGLLHKYVFHRLKCSPTITERICFTDGGRNGCPSNECLKLLEISEVGKKLVELFDELDKKTK